MKHKKVFTIPNILSMVRLLLIPLIVWLYTVKQDYYGALGVLILSGITDLADGFIARRYHMVSDLGKALDPVADKLTQIATLACLLTKFPHMRLPLGVLMVKEIVTGVVSLCAIRKSGQVKSADWHGKVTTALLYGVMGLHMLLPDIPDLLSMVLMGACVVMMGISGVLYGLRNYCQIKEARHG